MLLLICCLTAMLYQFTLPGNTDSDIRTYIGKGIVSFSGTVSEPPEASGSSVRYVISAESLEKEKGNAQAVEGKVLLSLPLGFDFKYGDRLKVTGELIAPPAGSGGSWRDYLNHRGIYTYSQYGWVYRLESGGGNPLLALLYGLREKGARVIDTIFPAPENALLRGILLGDESQISPLAREAYSITGTSHIIAISGFNMAVLAGIVAHVFTRRLGAQKGSLLTIVVLLLYTILVGAEASVMRAAFMGAFTVIASAIARRGNSLNNLGLSVLLMTLINPHLPWDVGFQLSAMATLGLALLATPLSARLTLWMNARIGEEASARVSNWIGEYLLITLVAQLAVLPLLLYHFRSFSWVFLIANPLILPVQPLVMILGLGGDDGWFSQPHAWQRSRLDRLAVCRLHQPDGVLARQQFSSPAAGSKAGIFLGDAGLPGSGISCAWIAMAKMAGISDQTHLYFGRARQPQSGFVGERGRAAGWAVAVDHLWAVRHTHAVGAQPGGALHSGEWRGGTFNF